MKILKADVEKRLITSRMPETLEEIHERQQERGYKPPKDNIRDLGPMVCTYCIGGSNRNVSSSARTKIELSSNYKKVNKNQNIKNQERYALNR